MNLARQDENDALSRKIMQALTDEDDVHASFRQRRRLATVDQLTGGIAHDFNHLPDTRPISVPRQIDQLLAAR